MTFTFKKSNTLLDAQRRIIMQHDRMDETKCLSVLLDTIALPTHVLNVIQQIAEDLVNSVRQQSKRARGLDAFLHEYSLSSEEGIVLMCLAESMLRVKDKATLNRLIQDKIGNANWDAHVGKSSSSFVNAASWALMLTDKILSPSETHENYFYSTFKRLVKRTSEPVIRKAVSKAMYILGKQFVMGQTIEEALRRSHKKSMIPLSALKKSPRLNHRFPTQKIAPAETSTTNLQYLFSYDMLGEAACTAEDAERYFQAYQHSIETLGKTAKSSDIWMNPSISVKLSALHPRYEFSQQDSCLPVLIQRLKQLALQAKSQHIGLTVDAEESYRLDISLDIIEAVMSDPALENWAGFGLALQAYQKRAFYVIDWLANLAKKTNRKMMLRLVKGAYWDSEIKDTQVKGLAEYPVFTRKASTDVSYLACAKKIIDYGDLFYPQFATHNAYTIAAILVLMGDRHDFEFQCLKGMDRELYDPLITDPINPIRCRIYAPVGTHEDLLPYLVRRLLENGANSSFVNRLVNEEIPMQALIAHPTQKINQLTHKPHPKIKLPSLLFDNRKNSQGLDFTNALTLSALTAAMNESLDNLWTAKPTILSLLPVYSQEAEITMFNPADRRIKIGTVVFSTPENIEQSIATAVLAAPAWNKTSVEERAACLEKLADLMEENRPILMAMLVKEAGKCMPDALGEVREAIDFCRYYAMLARQTLKPMTLQGPTGELNQLEMHGRGVFFCISPWNFPLAIFTGQITAGLVAGNCVIAKPAEPTSLIGAKVVEFMHQAGIPKEVVQLLPGKGSVIGPLLTADDRINGILFTGSTETARGINQTLSQRKGPIVPFIAETGGQNVMIADATALPEQLVQDVIASAFNSAGQRCSALRVLFLQTEMADKVIHLLKGAMQTLVLNDPARLSTDIGPVIHESARKTLVAHINRMNKEAKLIAEVPLSSETEEGIFFAPRVYEITSLNQLEKEIFGPVLHIIRYPSDKLDEVIQAINATGYGLTLGIHTRIKSAANYILERVRVGNRYINRNMIGAVVGVQPFGGEGLSGTGPKAGGPHYLTRLCCERVLTENTTAAGGNASLISMGEDEEIE